MGRRETRAIEAAHVEHYLQRHGYPDAAVESLTRLGEDTDSGIKSYGYGKPLRAVFTAGGERHDMVIRTMSADPFGHTRHADRVDTMLLAYDTFNSIPRHIEAIDIGAFDEKGELVSMARGEPFLVTEYVEGKLYADDLFALQGNDEAAPRDVERAVALARYLADLHSVKTDPEIYYRHVRDLVGSGEGIFGQADGQANNPGVADAARLQRVEQLAVDWRWKLRERATRACRTHGDFHPFNILFREGADFSVLDCSRGGVGEAADDVTCLSVNFLFVALASRESFDGALRQLWDTFWSAYLDSTGDRDLLGVVAPFFAWRLLVLTSPIWYPTLSVEVREVLFRLAERLLEGEAFTPDGIDALLK